MTEKHRALLTSKGPSFLKAKVGLCSEFTYFIKPHIKVPSLKLFRSVRLFKSMTVFHENDSKYTYIYRETTEVLQFQSITVTKSMKKSQTNMMI